MAGAPDTMRDVASWIRQAAQRGLPRLPRFEALVAAPPGRVHAVDGGAAVLADLHGVWVVAVRAHAVAWPADAGLPVVPEIVAVLAPEAPALLDARYSRWGLEPPRVASAQAFADALRDLAEMAAAIACVAPDAASAEAAPRPDLLLVDGALENLGRHAQPMADRIVEAADRAGVPVVGVAKQSRLRQAEAPLVPALAAAGPASCWAARVEGYDRTFVCRLHAAARHAFRTDVAMPSRFADRSERPTALAVLGRLLPLARDAVYLGYPYPLALAHNQVAITQAETLALRGGLEAAVHEAGGGDAVRLLDDFHAVLDDNVP